MAKARTRPETVESLLMYGNCLSVEEKVDSICGLIRGLVPTGLKAISKFVQRKRSKIGDTNPPEVMSLVQSMEAQCPAKRAKTINTSAWNSASIFRGDKVPTAGRVFLDVEKVKLKKSPGSTKLNYRSFGS